MYMIRSKACKYELKNSMKGKNLRDKKGIGATGMLTILKIQLQLFYGQAIRENLTDVKVIR